MLHETLQEGRQLSPVESEVASQLRELARQAQAAPQSLSEREALEQASQHSVSRALLLLSLVLSQSATA